MRVTDAHRFYNYQTNQQNVNRNLNDVFNQLSSGLKIQFGNEDPTAFINTLRLDQEVNTLKQSTANMTASQKFANHTDVALNDITKSLDHFKTKLVYAANEEHSQTSYGAIATELKGIRDYIINLANTNINGEYLFSGSATSVKPITGKGDYNGNDLQMKTLTGSNIESPYNISGADLFLGSDSDYSKSLTTNVVLYNQAKLHPSVMDPALDNDLTAKEEYIDAESSIRELVGDNDADQTNDANYFFYVSGVKSSGESFKEKIEMQTEQSVDALLTRIGEAYGNTSNNKVVDVSLNQGRIEIKDLQSGSSKLDFHMFGSRTDNNDVDALVSSGAEIMEFVKSPTKSIPTLSSINSTQNLYDSSIHTINTTLKTDNAIADNQTNLEDIFNDDVASIRLTGTSTTGAPVTFDLPKAGNKVSDLVAAIEANFGNVNATIRDNGKIEIVDESSTGSFNFTMQTLDAGSNPTTGIENDVAATHLSAFEVHDTYVRGNVAQVVTSTNEFATDKTKLSEVASNATVSGSVFNIDFTDVDGIEKSAQLDLTGASAVVNIDDDKDGTIDRSFTVLNAEYNDANNNGVYDGGEEVPTAPDDMTYKQLQDVMGMLVTNNVPTDLDRTSYKANIESATARTDVYVDDNGMLTIKDKETTQTNIRFGMYDSNANDFGAPASALSFGANNSLVVDDVHIDLFDMLNSAIEAVEGGFTRPDATHDTLMRNPGIQNLLDKLDHIHDHTVRKHTEIGAVSQSFDYQISRNETLSVHTKSLRSEIIDTDFGESAMRLSQLQLNYQAMASSMAKIQGLSLVNYL